MFGTIIALGAICTILATMDLLSTVLLYTIYVINGGTHSLRWYRKNRLS